MGRGRPVETGPIAHRAPSRTLGAVLLLALGLLPGTAQSQETCAAGSEPVEMDMLLEKTLFRVDVLTLEVRIRGRAAERLRALRDGATSGEALRDSVATLAAGATCADARLEFQRDVSLGRFLDGIRTSARAAMEADLVRPGTFRMIDESLPRWYAFLEGRGVREGDRMAYRIEGDTLRIRYLTVGGRLLLDRSDVGAARRRSVLAGYFAPGSDFRPGLIRSFLRVGEGEPGGGGR